MVYASEVLVSIVGRLHSGTEDLDYVLGGVISLLRID